jgi:hypothetical protein
LHIEIGRVFACSSATASASALVAFEAPFGMKRSMASSITAFVITLCPFSNARRRIPVRATPRTCAGTRSMRFSASGVQRTVSSAFTSIRGTSVRIVSSRSHGHERSRFSVFEPSPVSSREPWMPMRPSTRSQGFVLRT